MFHIISSNYNCTVLKDTLYHNVSQYDHFKYSNCSCNSVIEQYVSYDGEHSWPGGLAATGVNVSSQFSATYLMWQFFQNYTTTCLTTGINSINDNVNLKVYPNPITDELNVLCTNNEVYEFILYDLSSRKLLQQTFTNTTTINTEQLAKGMYLYTVRNKNGIIKNGKVIKQ